MLNQQHGARIRVVLSWTSITVLLINFALGQILLAIGMLLQWEDVMLIHLQVHAS